MNALRPELAPLPHRLQRLPIDDRGYVVPWFVQWMADGEAVPPMTPGSYPEFRVMDRTKWVRAVREKRCWVCGDPLGVHLVFVLGPMCGINRTTAEPACHRECAEWSAQKCPFLSRPHMVRRDNDGLVEECLKNAAGIPLDRNPGVTLLWTTKTFRIFDDGNGRPLIHIGDPESLRWFCEGRAATRAEVLASVEGGLPRLQQLAAEDGPEALATLEQYQRNFEGLYPAA